MNRQALAAYIYNEKARRTHIKGGGSLAAALLAGEAAGFAFNAEDMSAVVKGHTSNFRGNANDLLTYTSPSTKYVRNASGVLVPGTTLRCDHDANGNKLGLLIEGARTNLCPRSEEFDNASWTKFNATITPNSAVAPDGTMTADTWTAGAAEYPSAYRVITVSSATEHTLSVFAKAGTLDTLSLEFRGVGVVPTAVFNLSNGTVASGTGVTKDCGGGWYRCSITVTSVDTSEFIIIGADDDTPTLGGTLHLWGAQLEVGAFASSYIKTEGSQVTRNADRLTLATSAFPFNATEGTGIAEFTPMALDATTVLWALTEGTSNTEAIQCTCSGVRQIYVIDGGVVQADLSPGGDPVVGAASKVASAYKANDFAASLDGSAVATDVSGTLPAMNVLSIGSWRDGISGYMNGHIKSLVYLPRRMSNADLQVRTAA